MAEWVGTKIRQIATLPPHHPSGKNPDEAPEPRLGSSYNTWEPLRNKGQRTAQEHHFDKERATQKVRVNQKEKALEERGRSLERPSLTQKEMRRKELVEDSFPDQLHFLKHGETRTLMRLCCRVQMHEKKPENATMAFKHGSHGNPIFGRAWIISDAPDRRTRVLDNQVGDPRLWDPSDEEFWSLCRTGEPEEQALNKNRVLIPREDMRCTLCPQARSQELIPCCWCDSWVHWRCSYAVKSGRACASHFDVLSVMDKIVVTRKR